jgi:hypothetical protein
VRKSSIALAALSAASFVCLASAAQADTVFDTSLTSPPGVFFGTGNFNTHYAVTTADNGLEIGLKSKINKDASDSIGAVGDVYTIGLGNKVSFDYAVIPNGVDLTGVTATLTILNVGTGQTFSFDPSPANPDPNLGDVAGPGGSYENSEQIGFFPVGFSLTTNATYDITLSLSGLGGGGILSSMPGGRFLNGLPSGADTISVENVVVYGSGASVPEPTSWALMILGFGAAGVAMRRSRKTAAAATA